MLDQLILGWIYYIGNISQTVALSENPSHSGCGFVSVHRLENR